MNFVLKPSNDARIIPTGLALVGMLLSKTSLKIRLNHCKIQGVPHPYVSHGDIIYSYLALLCQGKKEYEAIDTFRDSDFFMYALTLKKVPSNSLLRQRFDMAGNHWNTIIGEESLNLIKNANAAVTPCIRDLIAMDIDVSSFDNYTPIFTYLGQEGYCIHVQLREDEARGQQETAFYLAQSIRHARKIANKPILLRMNEDNESADSIRVCQAPGTEADFIMKRNLKNESLAEWLHIAQNYGMCCEERPGKKVYMGDFEAKLENVDKPVRLVYRVVERTAKANGQIFLMPETEVETYWTSLQDPPYKIIELYHEHGTIQQFHNEIKADLDLGSFPSGKFETNELILQLGVMAYNILRIIGQMSMKKQNLLPSREIYRSRTRTVIQRYLWSSWSHILL